MVQAGGFLHAMGAMASSATAALRHWAYRAAGVHRLNQDWQPQHYSGDSAAAEAWDLLTRRVRDLARNDPAILALKRAILDNTIATGIGTVADVQIAGEHDDLFNFEADEAFEEWAEQDADFDGKLSWPDMQRRAVDQVLETGDVLLLQCAEPSEATGRRVPLCYQTLETEQLDRNKDTIATPGHNEIRQGIEYDARGRVVAYWLYQRNPYDYHGGVVQSYRVPASRVIHLHSPARPSATRGVSIYAASAQPARDLDNYLAAELTAANINALYTLVHYTDTPGKGLGFAGDGSGHGGGDGPRVKLGRGIVVQIPVKDKVEPIATNRPNTASDIFTRLILMLVGMGAGVSRYRITRDYTGTTYVAARAAHLDDRASFRPLQAYLGRQLCLPVRREWTRQMVALGRFKHLGAREFLDAPRTWLRTKLQMPGWEQIDPEKETNAAIASIRGGISTLDDVCSLRGKNWRRQILQRAREEAFARKHGVTLNYDLPSMPNNGSKDEPPDEPDGDEDRGDETTEETTE